MDTLGTSPVQKGGGPNNFRYCVTMGGYKGALVKTLSGGKSEPQGFNDGAGKLEKRVLFLDHRLRYNKMYKTKIRRYPEAEER